MSEQQDLAANKRVVVKLLHALSQMRVDEARELMHEQCECHLPNIAMKPGVFDREGMLGFIEVVKKAIPGGIRMEIVEQTAEDNRVSTVANGYSKTVEGKDYNNRYHFLHYLKDGKVVRHLEYFDSYLGAKVLGPILGRLLGKS